MTVFPTCLPSHQLVMKSWPGWLVRLDLAAGFFRFPIPTLKIVIDFLSVAMVISQNGMNICQRDDVRVTFCNGFCSHALVVVIQNNL